MSSFDASLNAETAHRLQTAIDDVRTAVQPLQRNGTPQDVAQAVVYLASDRSLQVTGMLLPVDGGITAGDPVNHPQKILQVRSDVLAS
jgi:NAD(P)-dependent dehydrogenase (short-subunit alcohol dehydrogenase family)